MQYAVQLYKSRGGDYFGEKSAESIPGYAKIGFLITFVFFNSFAINMFLQYKKIGKLKDYLYGERVYIVLSLVAKSALAWILVVGTIGQAAK